MTEVMQVRRVWKDKSKVKFDWQPWFRGESSCESPTALQPKLYRSKAKIRKLLYDEQEMRLEFRRCGPQLITEWHPGDRWEWYFVMQHYGAPTRLLDWSDGALVALYFAVRNRARQPEDAAVYMLDPWWLNGCAFKTLPVRRKDRPRGVALPNWDESDAYLPEDEFDSTRLGPRFPLAIDPGHVSRRLAAQRSRFTIFGREKDGLNELTADKKARVMRVPIRAESLRDIQRELKVGGISESTIFPDLEGFGRELSGAWEWRRMHRTER
jgi:hypothetical protein